MQERPPSQALVLKRTETGKRRPVGALPGARLRVRRPAGCAGRAAPGGSSPRGIGRLAVAVAVCVPVVRTANGIGCASTGGDQAVE
jgi:hypothetical protein